MDNRNFHYCKFLGQIMNTAYSTIDLAPTNTAEHFQLAAHLGFNALKGDVRITSDDKLVMCHDPGITLDANGRIEKLNKENYLKFRDLTYDFLMGLEYSPNYGLQCSSGPERMGHYAHVCSFDTYIRICKETGKIAYVTLRDHKIPILVAGVMETLRKYHMENHCVINSFTFETLQEVRKYSENIPLSQVHLRGRVLTMEDVDRMVPLGNSMITMFLYPTTNPEELWEQSAQAVAYAREKNIPVHMAQVRRYSDYCDMIAKGIQGFHLTRAILPYTRTDIHFTVTVRDGEAQFGNILNADRLNAEVTVSGSNVIIENIRNGGSGYGYDDGLPVLWLNVLPYTLEVSCSQNPDCSIRFEDNALKLNTGNKNGTYMIHVNI